MYVLILFATFTFTNGLFCEKLPPSWKHPRSPTWRHPNSPPWKRRHSLPVDPEREIAKNHIDFEAALQNYCEHKTNNHVNEVYGSENYILKYDISEYKNAKFSVKIINRLIQITAKKDTDGNTQEFKDVRVLPDILIYEKASWIFESKMLKIFIPYSIAFSKDIVKDCGALNRNIIDVPLQKSGKIDLR